MIPPLAAGAAAVGLGAVLLAVAASVSGWWGELGSWRLVDPVRRALASVGFVAAIAISGGVMPGNVFTLIGSLLVIVPARRLRAGWLAVLAAALSAPHLRAESILTMDQAAAQAAVGPWALTGTPFAAAVTWIGLLAGGVAATRAMSTLTGEPAPGERLLRLLFIAAAGAAVSAGGFGPGLLGAFAGSGSVREAAGASSLIAVGMVGLLSLGLRHGVLGSSALGRGPSIWSRKLKAEEVR